MQTVTNVTVPESPVEVSNEQIAHLRRTLGTITDDEHGIYKYLAVIDFLESLHELQ